MRVALKECKDALIEIYDIIEEIDPNKLSTEEEELLRDIIVWSISIINLAQELLFKSHGR